METKLMVYCSYEGMQQTVERYATLFDGFEINTRLISHNNTSYSLNSQSYTACFAHKPFVEKIEKETNLRCYPIEISDYDILAVARLAQHYDSKSIFLADSYLASRAVKLFELLKMPIEVIPLEENNQSFFNNELTLHKDKLILVTPYFQPYVEELGLHNIMCTSSTNSIIESLKRGIRYLEDAKEDFHHYEVLQDYLTPGRESFYIFSEEGDKIIQFGNHFSQRIENTLANLVPEVLAENNISRSRFIQSEPYHIKGRNIDDHVVFQIVPSIEDNRTSVPGLLIKNKENLSTDFYNVFYDDLRHKEVQNKVVAYGEATDPVVIIGESGTGKTRMADFIYLQSQYKDNLYFQIDCKQVDNKSLDYIFHNMDSPIYEQGITLYFKEINLLRRKYRDEIINYLGQSVFLKRNKVVFSVTCEIDESFDNPLCNKLINQLGSFPIYISPLRSRINDISSLATIYINDLNEEYGKTVVGFEPEAMDYLKGFGWSDNIKQFKRVLRELFVITTKPYISVSDTINILREERIRDTGVASDYVLSTSGRTLDEITKIAVRNAMINNSMNQTQAAKELGISRTTLWRYLRED